MRPKSMKTSYSTREALKEPEKKVCVVIEAPLTRLTRRICICSIFKVSASNQKTRPTFLNSGPFKFYAIYSVCQIKKSVFLLRKRL